MTSLALAKPRRAALDLASRTCCGIEGAIVVVGGCGGGWWYLSARFLAWRFLLSTQESSVRCLILKTSR